MLIEHQGKSPCIDEDAWVAPDATLCGDVTVGPGSRVMHGARLIAEGGSIAVGRSSIVMQNAVLRSTVSHDCSMGDHVLVGPGAHVVGSTVEDEVFLATGTAIFHASRLGRGSVVRINGVVHVNSVLAPETTVPIGWIACGNPAQLFSPDRHDDLWAVQERMNFALTAYGIEGPMSDSMAAVTTVVSERLAGHREDRLL